MAVLGAVVSSPASSKCFEDAARKYDLPESLLRAIAHVESGDRDASTVVNTNRNGTIDYGRMQINSVWLPKLARYGIGRQQLLDECTSIHVGAWILSHNVYQLGFNWNAIGAYNVGCRSLSADECSARRNRYAWKVFTALTKRKPTKAPAVEPAKYSEPSPQITAVTFDDEVPDTVAAEN